MEERKLTVQEAVDELLMSQSSIYSWIEKGKLKSEDHQTGKVIVISSKEIEEIKNFNLRSRRNKVSKQNYTKNENFQEIPVIDAEYSRNYEENVTNYENSSFDGLMNVSEEFAKYVSELSAKAGKYELLADLQREKEADKEFWKNQYFEMKSAYDNLQETLKNKELENLALQKQIEAMKPKSGGLFQFFQKKD